MPPLGYTAEPSVTPIEVEVSGPASKVDDLREIKTESVDLHGAPESFQRSVLLSWAGDFVSFTPDHVIVAVTFEPTMMVRRFEHVEVATRNVPEVGYMAPLRIFRRVLFPDPLMPMTPMPTPSGALHEVRGSANGSSSWALPRYRRSPGGAGSSGYAGPG